MAIPAYMTIEGIEGSVTVKGREGTIEVLEFDHSVYMPVDRDTGTISGTRKHGAITLHKVFDKSSPLLYEHVCSGKVIPKIKITWYEIKETGSEGDYFTYELEGCRISSVRSYMHNIKDKSKELFVHQEELSIRYERITWTYIDGAISHTDEWDIRENT